MHRPCGELREALAVYVLGAIEPADRSVVDRHLPGCADCRDELAGLAALPALLRRVSVAEATAFAVGCSDRPWESALLARSCFVHAGPLVPAARTPSADQGRRCCGRRPGGRGGRHRRMAGRAAARAAGRQLSASVDRHVQGGQPADPGQRNRAVCGIAMGPAAERAGNRNPARHGMRAGGHQPRRPGGGRRELDHHRPPGCLVSGVGRGAAVRNPGVRTLRRIEDPGPTPGPGRYHGAAQATGRKILVTLGQRRFCGDRGTQAGEPAGCGPREQKYLGNQANRTGGDCDEQEMAGTSRSRHSRADSGRMWQLRRLSCAC